MWLARDNALLSPVRERERMKNSGVVLSRLLASYSKTGVTREGQLSRVISRVSSNVYIEVRMIPGELAPCKCSESSGLGRTLR